MKNERVPLVLEHVWEITSEHGTRHLVDLRGSYALRMRIPVEGRQQIWAGRDRIMNQDADFVDAARSILDAEDVAGKSDLARRSFGVTWLNVFFEIPGDAEPFNSNVNAERFVSHAPS